MILFQKSSRTAQESPLLSPDDFAQFYEQSHPAVFRYLMVLCNGNQDEAEDITAEAFFRAWEKRRQFSGSPAAAFGWVITIARNVLIDHRRSEDAHPIELIQDEAVVDEGSPVEEILVEEEQSQAVLEMLQALPFPQKDLLTLRYMFGWRVQTIADHLGLSENAVSVKLRRASARLQREMTSRELIASGRGEGRTA